MEGRSESIAAGSDGRRSAGEGEGRVYFPGLDGLRAVAFALVYGFHDRRLDLLNYVTSWVEIPLAMAVDPLLMRVGLPEVSFRLKNLLNRPFQTNGWVGVQVFFALSGFLITTLLIRERDRLGRVDLGAFWVRRALRIWPLYYLVVVIVFGLVPLPGIWGPMYVEHLPWFLGFLGNWSMVFRGPPPSDSITILWSVCVEEQFYLFVPLLIAFVGPRWRIPVVSASIGLAVANRYDMAAAGIVDVGLRYNSFANLDTLLSGVLLALVARRFPSVVRPSWPWRMLVVAGGVVIATKPLCRGGPWDMALGQVLIWAWALGVIVLASDPTDRWTSCLRRPTFVWLGRISYGLYMYHEIAIGHVLRLGDWLPSFPDREFLLAVLGPSWTIALATASYYGIERPFLRLKRRWTRVPSRPIDEGEGESDRAMAATGDRGHTEGDGPAPAPDQPPALPLP